MSGYLPPIEPAALSAPRPALAPAAERVIIGTRRLVLADALVGIPLTLVIAAPVAATVVVGLWGDRLTRSSPDSMFAGLDVVLGWIAVVLLCLVLGAALAIAALVLDILVAVRALELTTGRLGVVVRGGRRLLFALIGACGIVSTPVLWVLSMVPAGVFGAGRTTNAMLVVLLGLAFAVPIMCRLLLIAFSRELTIVGPAPPPGQRRQIAARPHP